MLLLTALLVALALAACGDDRAPAAPADAPTAIPAPAEATTAAPAEAATAVPNEAPAEAPAEGKSPESPLVAAGKSPLPTPVADSPLATPPALLPAESSLGADFEASGIAGQTSTDTGAIVGRILISRDGVDTPVGGVIVGLADVIRDEAGVPRASGYSPDTPNRSSTNDDGGFAIDNVPVGMYSLILDGVITSYQLIHPETGETILVEVEAGETFDIGVIRYESLPIPGFGTAQ